MTETVRQFIEFVDKWQNVPDSDYLWLMPRDMMIALRDELKESPQRLAEKIHEGVQLVLASDGGER